MDRWSTHIAPLVRMVSLTNGPVLELGCGYYSTPILHAMCLERRLVSAESDFEWMRKFESLASDLHEFHHILNWKDTKIPDSVWDVAFVDHRPALQRKEEIARLVNSHFVVVHDSEDPSYEYEESFSLYKYRYDYKFVEPWTTILSNFEEIKAF